MKSPNFKILPCPECERETLMVQTTPLLKQNNQYDKRWLYLWFCSSCSKYFEIIHNLNKTAFTLNYVKPMWDGNTIFNPNNLGENEWREIAERERIVLIKLLDD